MCVVVFFGSLTLLANLKPINAVGMISASIFVVHPFVRMVLYKAFGNSALSITAMVAVYLAIVMVFSILHHLFYRRVAQTKPHNSSPE